MTLFPFQAFFDKPAQIRFAEQESDEQIELMLRQHWITNVPWILMTSVLILIPGIFIQIINATGIFLVTQIPGDIMTAGLIMWYLGVLAYVVEKFLYWYFNIYIITNKHLVDIDFYNITYRDITEIQLEDVQAVSSSIAGIIRSLFGFGDVVIETAARTQNIEFKDVPKPDVVADRIEDLRSSNQSHASGHAHHHTKEEHTKHAH